MKYKPYAEYKDSGIEWIGDIPRGWEVKKLKYVCSVNDGALPENTLADYEMRYVDIGSVTFEKGITEYQEILFENSPSRARRLVKNGDVIVSTVRTYLKAISGIKDDKNVIVSTGFAVVRPKKIFENFLNYAVRNPYFVETVSANSVGVSYPAINASDMMCIKIPYPQNKNEQIVIADYLDAETAKITSIIATKQKLIEKLQEKRSSVISHAVTKGLDPTAKMKPSGIEWIGDIPEGWEVKRLKYVSTITTGNTPSKTVSDFYCEDGLSWVKPDNLNGFIPIGETKEYLSETGIEVSRIAKARSVLICCIGTIGKFGYSLNDVAYNQQINAITFNNKVNWKYGLYYLSCQQEQHRYYMNGNVVYILNGENQKRISISVPALPDQIAIASYLDTETAKIDNIIAKTKTSIEKLNEYKTALISACVTGKIDVRRAKNVESN